MNYYFKLAKRTDLQTLININNTLNGYRWNDGKFSELFDNNVPIIMAYSKDHNDMVIGFLACIFVLDELRILNIVVLPEFRKQAVAENLIYASINYSLRYGCRYALLEVFVGNKPALNLYKKLGFYILSLREEYYEDFTNAYFMELVFKDVKIPYRELSLD